MSQIGQDSSLILGDVEKTERARDQPAIKHKVPSSVLRLLVGQSVTSSTAFQLCDRHCSGSLFQSGAANGSSFDMAPDLAFSFLCWQVRLVL